jgi:hypothetical protein
MSEYDPDLPKPVGYAGAITFGSQVEDFKDKLLHEALAERLGRRAECIPKAPRSSPDSLVSAKVVAAVLGACRRTLGRRIYEPRRAGMNRSAGRQVRRPLRTKGGRNGSLR